MKTVTSKDGTTIAFDQIGKGPVVILVDGALQYRAFDQGMAELADLLSKHFTVIHYDRRGRGDSTDSQTYELEREIEDIESIINEAGGSAFLYGISSGAALALEAAIKLPDKIKKLVMYEAPYNDDDNARKSWKEYRQKLMELVKQGRKRDAVGHFMMLVGMSPDQLEGMHQHPMWPLWEAVGLTLAYDAIAMGEDSSLPTKRAAKVAVPTLVMNGSQSFPFMHDTAVALARAIPNAKHRTLEGQTHEVSSEALAPVLIEFFKS
ncbi:MAG TPA: alpha/beta hydrolase [Anaerolineales bacterium]|nr:alpha/beta hydrolase [Anaerolineales bacterium]